jgi:type IV pilus assembly protein PilA
MGHGLNFRTIRRYLSSCIVLIAVMVLICSVCVAQGPAEQTEAKTGIPSLDKYPGLLQEFAQLLTKLKNNVQFPAERSASGLLPLLPQSTVFYTAIPNYGNVAEQSLKIFRQELQESAVLRDWWEHEGAAADKLKIEEALQKFSALQQYLGEEIVVSAAMEGEEPRVLIAAEARKPGLKKYLRELVKEIDGQSQPSTLVVDLQELGEVSELDLAKKFVVLVRPDYVVAALDLKTLRSFNERLDSHKQEFAATPFGQRILQEYRDGVTTTGAVDAKNILMGMNQASPAMMQNATFQASGFADLKYVVWGHKKIAGRAISEVELSFDPARRGAAGWLGKPRAMGSLDFVSPQAVMASTFVLNNPAQIFEDLKEFASQSKSSAFSTIAEFEQGLNLSLKDDVLAQLGGEVAFELDPTTQPQPPSWKAMLQLKDAKHLQQTLSALMAGMHLHTDHFEDGGTTYYTLQIPSGKTSSEIAYAFVDGYLVLGSTRGAVVEAARVHRSGESLPKSQKFLDSVPPGRSQEASAIFYENPLAMVMRILMQASPEMARPLASASRNAAPLVLYVYGEEAAIREVSTRPAFDASAVLIIAAIAIPNLLRSRTAANEASAAGSVRTLNTAEITYSATYPKRGYAPNLATLGPGPTGTKTQTPEHADLIDDTLGNISCKAGAWCSKSGYQFRVKAVCKLQHCGEYLVVATPVTTNTTGTRSFCSTSDGVIRSADGALPFPESAADCRKWLPLQ